MSSQASPTTPQRSRPTASQSQSLSHPAILHISTTQPPSSSTIPMSPVHVDASNSNSNRHSNRWVRLFHFFQPSRRRRASYSPNTNTNHNQSSHSHSQSPHILIDASSLPRPSSTNPTTSASTTTTTTNNTANTTNSSTNNSSTQQLSSIGIRRATRRERHLRLRHNVPRDRQHSRRTMSDGAIPPSNSESQQPVNSVTPSSSTSISPSLINSTTSNRSNRVPFSQTVTSMRYRRMSTSNRNSNNNRNNRNNRNNNNNNNAQQQQHEINSSSNRTTPTPSHASVSGVRSFALSDSNTDIESIGLDDNNTLQAHGSSGGSSNTSAGIPSVPSSPQSGESRTSTLVSSAIPDLDNIPEHDLFTVNIVNRFLDDYSGGPPSDHMYQSINPVYLGRIPGHSRQRLAMRVQNAYLIPGRRQGRGYGNVNNNNNSNNNSDNNNSNSSNTSSSMRIGISGITQHHLHHHLHHSHGGSLTLHGPFGLEDREIRLNALHTTLGGAMFGGSDHHRNRNNREAVATEQQIEALPSFVMEKGEKRSVKDIFETIKKQKNKEKSKVDDNDGQEDNDNEDEKPVKSIEESNEKESKKVITDSIDKEEHGDQVEKEGNEDETGGLMTSYTECAICLSDFEAGDEITALPCGHFFHLNECVREWLCKHARTCPTCRADICEKD